MNKAVLIAIQPYYVFLIIARAMGWTIPQHKTVEVRKDFPKDSAWNKVVHIYCSKNRKSFNRIPKQYQPSMQKLLGKVIGEFVCDCIDEFACDSRAHRKLSEWGSCLTEQEIRDYCNGQTLYAWHISDLKIYDKPKKLEEFFVEGECEEDSLCRTCKYFDKGNECAEVEPDCLAYGIKPLTRPPQSWCYVEG